MKPIEDRDYQRDAIESLRAAIREGKRRILLVAPTGSGKTTIASILVRESQNKGKRSAFLVDRKSLIKQTSETFDLHGIAHGIIQADHTRHEPTLLSQICSIQTLARRRWPEAQLLIIDEAHSQHEAVRKKLEARDTVAIGLTATPFTKGLGKLYDTVVNVTTTNKLIDQGYLSPYRIYSCAEPDMTGVRVVSGEWERKETEKRALQVVGDVVQEYIRHGMDRKFICSAVDTAHVYELQRQFLAAGIYCETYTYKDADEDREETLEEFRRPDSSIRGLVTVTAASKGFDCPDIGCVIMARPLRSSLAEHIQFFGRGLRVAEGKEDCIILDHSGNCARFWTRWKQVFEHGVESLDDGVKAERPAPKEATEKEPIKCSKCGYLHDPRPFCPACGFEHPKRGAVEHVPGSLKELIAAGTPSMVTEALWPQVCHYAREREARKPSAKNDHGQGYALWLFKEITGAFPKGQWFDSTVPVPPTPEVEGRIKYALIRAGHRRRKAVPA
ncbi:DEAD/DEAH box helicase [Pseudacidovorax intermedius]|uniref:DEAD/DEAH box helicase n=1 Tax=Pseudacidovorax intermedius TaxID=433924 RepID=UPI00034A3292|nr:DEAD/DEAH box helicase [Pseudacidovorax intermedius]